MLVIVEVEEHQCSVERFQLLDELVNEIEPLVALGNFVSGNSFERRLRR